MTVADDSLDWDRLFYGGPTERTPPVNGRAPVPDHPMPYIETALKKESLAVADATQGTRNHTLNTAAFNLGQLVGAGLVSRDRVEEQLRWAGASCGLDRAEVESTMRSGLEAGIKDPRQVRPMEVTSVIAEVSAEELLQEATGGDLTNEDGTPVRTSWWGPPIRQIAAQALGVPTPTHLRRLDGEALLYSGKVNGLIGESESGKSWVAMLAAVQAVQDGEMVLILDFEDSPRSVQDRFIALGVEDDQLDQIFYAQPDEALGAAQRGDLAETLQNQFSLIVVDGVNSAMNLLGYDLNSNDDATAFFLKFLRPLARDGACVITVDHVPKNSEARGKGGIGAQAKRAMTDGCAIRVEVIEPFGKGQSGKLRLEIDKDRPGHVRGVSQGALNPGTVVITSILDTVRLEVEPPDGASVDRTNAKLAALMERISILVEDNGSLTGRAIREAIRGRDAAVLDATNILADHGYLQRAQGPNRSWLYSSLIPFRADEEVGSSVVPGGSLVVPGTSTAGGSRFPLPEGGGTTKAPPGNQSENRSVVPERCRRCGDDVDRETWDAHDGFCRSCDRIENP